jgi:hypothetical protein
MWMLFMMIEKNQEKKWITIDQVMHGWEGITGHQGGHFDECP